MKVQKIQFDKKLFNTLLAYFIRGVLLVVPFALTWYIISIAVNWVDSFIRINIPGLGTMITIIAITFFGYLGSSWLVRSIFDAIEKFVIKVPLINLIYTSLKELIAAFVGKKKKFDKPVLVTVNLERMIQKVGFITQTDLESLNLSGSVAVYVPQSYSFSGELYIVPKEMVKPLPNLSGTEVMKFVISGGVTDLQAAKDHEGGEASKTAK
jgi:uncharacterized membrane protein